MMENIGNLYIFLFVCVQSIRSRMYVWSVQPGAAPYVDVSAPGPRRISGPVCGQDPNYCVEPKSATPFVWEDAVAKWPKCMNSTKPTDPEAMQPYSNLAHMTCDMVARPCCVGVLAQCMMTTREHCAFLRGYYHQDAFLCSQVDCLSDVCGMLPFYKPNVPDQFYRLFLSLFLHAGYISIICCC
jgi:hypothetical protein